MTKIEIPIEKLITAEDKFEAYKDEKIELIKNVGNIILTSGFPYDFGPPYGVQHLQLRDDTDRTNWLTAAQGYQAQIALGNGDYPGATFRTAENNNITITFNQAYMVLMTMIGWGQHLFTVSWTKQDQVRACTTKTEVDAIDPNEGWQ